MTSSFLSNVSEYYKEILSSADTRTKGWFMVDCLDPVIFWILFYVFIVWVGPKLMQNKKPFKLTFIMITYNFIMAFLNLYIFIQILTASTRLKYSYTCEPLKQSFHPDELQIADACWWYFFSKLLEFLDTLFFILRKKSKQLSFLHVYHHATMLFFCWIGVKWVPTGSSFLLFMINSGIHVVMYTYYGLAAFGPQISKYLWWKKYLTIIQMLQFVALILFGVNLFVTDCKYPHWMYYTGIIYMTSFIVLFGKFYKQAYAKRGNQIFLGMDIGCGQGNMYDQNEYSSLTDNHKGGMKTE